MSDETLSQDEIDALLGTTGLEENEDESFDIDIYTLGEALRASIEPAFDRFDRALGTDGAVQVEVGAVEQIPYSELLAREVDWVECVFQIAGPLQGEFRLLLAGAWVTGVARLSGSEEESSTLASASSSLNEHLESVATTLSDQLSALLHTPVSTASAGMQPLVEGTESASSLGPDEAFLAFELTLVAGNDVIEPGYLLIAEGVAEQLLESLTAVAQTPPPVAPAATPRIEPIASAAPPSEPTAPLDPTPVVESVAAKEESAAASERRVSRPSASPPLRAPAFDDLGTLPTAGEGQENIDLLLDVPLQVTVELGRAKKEIREILSLAKGHVIELDKLAGEPVDVFVNGKLIAKGEVVVMDENFGVRISSIVSRMDRMQNLQ